MHLGKKKKYNVGCIVWDLVIWMALSVKRDYIEKQWLYIYIYIYEIFDNRPLIGVEFKFLNLDVKVYLN